MQVIDTKSKNTKYKTHKFSCDKQNKNIKICKKCNYKIYKMKELQGSVWVNDIGCAISDLMMIIMNDSLSKMSSKKNEEKEFNFDDQIEIIDVFETCDEHVIKNVIE